MVVSRGDCAALAEARMRLLLRVKGLLQARILLRLQVVAARVSALSSVERTRVDEGS